jgi:predicted ATPase
LAHSFPLSDVRQALDEARRQGSLAWELRAAMSLARRLGDQGRLAEASAILRPVYDQFVEGADTADLVAAKRLLVNVTQVRWIVK